MKPTKLGELPTEQQDKNAPIQIDDSETRLLYQEFLMKPSTRVLDFLNENHVVLNDFVRFQCGEILEDAEK